jgi:cell division septum initiation protein DivIVA
MEKGKNDMARCEDCIHKKVCAEVESLQCRRLFAWYNAEWGCPHFNNAADVVPKSEVDKLLEINADLNESLRLAAEANKDLQVELAAMRTAANSFKMHYEDLKLKYADLQKDHDELLAWGGHIKSAERAEIGKAVAREIFGEIEYNFAEIRKIEYDNPPVGVMFNTLDYLKKKRTEEKG